MKRARTAIEEVEEHTGYFRDDSGAVYLCREDGGRRVGLWRLPLVSEPERVAGTLLLRFAYPITRYRVFLHVHGLQSSGPLPVGGRWVSKGELETLALASPYRRALQRLAASGSSSEEDSR